MAGHRKWRHRSKSELKLVWLVVEELYYDMLHPKGAAMRPVHFEATGATVTSLVHSGDSAAG